MEEIGTAYKEGMVGAALGGVFYHKRKIKVMKYEEATKNPGKPYWEDALETEYKKFLENCF